ncbi:TBC1 domain family member 31 [Lamellibrachia satsuma]|nr:TBC1 domain family member 31 [Lamellibrachia satsuma]
MPDLFQVFFLPLSNTIMTCFKDDSIFAWESDSLTCKYQLHTPEEKSPHFKTFTASKDGRLLVGGGRSRFLHMWSLETRKLLRIVQLPTKVTCVRQLEFLPDAFDAGASLVLGVLSQDGIMRFIHIDSCKLIFDIGCLDNRILSVSISSTRRITAVMDNGNVNVYSAESLTEELNRPPLPLVSVVDKNQKLKKVKVNVRPSKVNIVSETVRLNSAPTELPEGLNMNRLLAILHEYGEYPTKYRMFIWRSILRLPENHSAYGALVDKGTHPRYEKLHEKFPIKSRKLLRVLQRVLSSLAHWAPIFGETDYLPMIAFPFVKLFQNNQLICFEVIASILVNWCQHWFEYFPNPPINMLSVIENVLAYHDKELLQHFVTYGVTSQVYAWPLLETFFSEVLTKDEWLRLMDNLFSNHPAMLLMVTVAYCIVSRRPLLHCCEFDDFKYFFHHRNSVDIRQVLKETYHLIDTTPSELNPLTLLEAFEPLTHEQYPVFNKYPKFIVDYQIQERERIRQEEQEYLQQRTVALEFEKETLQRQTQEEAWYRQQQLLLAAEEKRRQLISAEEDKLANQRTRLSAMNRELKLKEMQLLDSTRRKFINYQQQQKEAELARLDDELRHKVKLRDSETKAAVNEAEIKNMELHLQNKMFEQDLHRDYVTRSHQHKADYSDYLRRVDLEGSTYTLPARDSEKAFRELEGRLAHSQQQSLETRSRADIEKQLRLDQLEQQTKTAKLHYLHEENRKLEETIEELMGNLAKYQPGATTQSAGSTGQDQSHKDAEWIQSQLGTTQQKVNRLQQTQEQIFERLRELNSNNSTAVAASASEDMSTDVPSSCLNASTNTDASTQFSLDRGRQSFEERERNLMAEVRRMRQNLAKEALHKEPPPAYALSCT